MGSQHLENKQIDRSVFGSPRTRVDVDPPDLSVLGRPGVITWHRRVGHPAPADYAAAFEISHRVRRINDIDGPGGYDWGPADRPSVFGTAYEEADNLRLPYIAYLQGMHDNVLEFRLADVAWVDPPFRAPLQHRYLSPTALPYRILSNQLVTEVTLPPVTVAWNRSI